VRLFQNSGLYPSYIRRLSKLSQGANTFAARIEIFLADRYGAPHFLAPVLRRESDAFITNGNDGIAQRLWSTEQGMPEKTRLEDILLAQIEHHRTEVFYDGDPMRYGSPLVRRLPGSVKRRIAWRAAPSPGADFSAYDLVVCNFPSILESYRQRGWPSAYFTPAHDPEANAYASRRDRPIDVVFVGGYSRHHRQRAAILEGVAAIRGLVAVTFHLERSRLNRLAESTLGRLLPLAAHRRQADIVAVTEDPVFGRDLYEVLSKSKIVLNGAVDMAGEDRGNMRCFEAMGCGCLLLSDTGRYPEGMVDGDTLVTYRNTEDAVARIQGLLACSPQLESIAAAGHSMVNDRYSKTKQWAKFCSLVA
jgi:glycosyltransferase involved in cell wall biosynthesis